MTKKFGFDGPESQTQASIVMWWKTTDSLGLFSNQFVDVLHIWTYPITLGNGKKLFDEGTPAQEWQLKESVVSTKGGIMASYAPSGEVKSGSYVPDKVSDAEIERRKKWMIEEGKGSKV